MMQSQTSQPSRPRLNAPCVSVHVLDRVSWLEARSLCYDSIHTLRCGARAYAQAVQQCVLGCTSGGCAFCRVEYVQRQLDETCGASLWAESRVQHNDDDDDDQHRFNV